MSSQAADKKLFVDDVVTALTGTVQPSGDSRGVFQDQMQRATEEFDLRTAEAFARALLEALCQDPIDPRRLEALLILGLAHPTILDRHRISLQKEGDRLAAMLIGQGQHDRARTLLDVIANATVEQAAQAERALETSSTADTAKAPLDAQKDEPAATASVAPPPSPVERDHARIEALLRQADEAAERGRTARAIHLLQEVVSLDRHRRDVARMIRDLRWQEQDRRARSMRRLKTAVLVLALGACVAGLVWRETGVRQRYAAIPTAKPGDLAAMRARLESIDGLVAEERLWVGMAAALTERTELQREVSDLEMRLAAQNSEVVQEKARNGEMADAARSRGMLMAQQGRFEDALVDLRRALELGGPGWPQRRDVETNITAIADWIEKRPERQGNGR
ncbi:MAG: hypothetical protein NTY35_15690 [Planctomycetota bacterium]|nr:hypothetical protein [Planctomycetota bacterium]